VRNLWRAKAGSPRAWILTFDLSLALRRIKPQRITSRLHRRRDEDLQFVAAPASPGPELMLDTCVYIDVLQGHTPVEVDELLEQRIVNHSTVSLSELTHLFGRLDPAHADTAATLRELRGVIDDIPSHRLSAPSERVAGGAGMLAGLVARAAGRDPGVALLNDALLMLHALESGCVLLTRNLADFDVLQQLMPQSQVLFYDRV
jgi:predicted nucleic acid-binding protein